MKASLSMITAMVFHYSIFSFQAMELWKLMEEGKAMKAIGCKAKDQAAELINLIMAISTQDNGKIQ